MKYLAAFFLLASSPAWANGNGVGNGGKVIRCPGQARPLETFDIYEGRVLFGETPVSCEGRGYAACLHAQLEPLLNKFPITVEKLLGAVDRFPRETLLLRGQTLPDVPDDEHLFLPNGCNLEQLAIEADGAPSLPPGKKYVVNADLLDQLTPEDQAAAVLHEVLQAEREVGKGQNTPMVRRVVMDYLSGAVAGMTEQQFFEFYAENRKTWSSIRRGMFSWETQDASLMDVGHTTLEFSAGKLTHATNDLQVVGKIRYGAFTLSSLWSYDGGEDLMDVSPAEEGLVFNRPSLLGLKNADETRPYGKFHGVRRVDERGVCARSFEPEPGQPAPAAKDGCWAWSAFGG